MVEIVVVHFPKRILVKKFHATILPKGQFLLNTYTKLTGRKKIWKQKRYLSMEMENREKSVIQLKASTVA